MELQPIPPFVGVVQACHWSGMIGKYWKIHENIQKPGQPLLFVFQGRFEAREASQRLPSLWDRFCANIVPNGAMVQAVT